jgi:hypothetical protein
VRQRAQVFSGFAAALAQDVVDKLNFFLRELVQLRLPQSECSVLNISKGFVFADGKIAVLNHPADDPHLIFGRRSALQGNILVPGHRLPEVQVGEEIRVEQVGTVTLNTRPCGAPSSYPPTKNVISLPEAGGFGIFAAIHCAVKNSPSFLAKSSTDNLPFFILASSSSNSGRKLATVRGAACPIEAVPNVTAPTWVWLATLSSFLALSNVAGINAFCGVPGAAPGMSMMLFNVTLLSAASTIPQRL